VLTVVLQDEIWKTRVIFLGERERAAMELFLEKKMEESNERILIDDWVRMEAKVRMSEVLFDRVKFSTTSASDELEVVFKKLAILSSQYVLLLVARSLFL
jgi:hypothetical protein